MSLFDRRFSHGVDSHIGDLQKITGKTPKESNEDAVNPTPVPLLLPKNV